jgi:hypothetical protein
LLRRFGTVVAALVAFVVVGTASAAQSGVLTRSWTFDTTNDEWFVFSGGNFSPATWQSSGNPGGSITAQFSPPSSIFLQSTGSLGGGATDPGNALGDYGGTLKVDISASDPTSEAAVGFFSKNSLVLPCVIQGNLGAAWTTVTATLNTGHLRNCNSNAKAPPRLTGAQASAALADYDGMFVIPHDTDSNPDTVSLDNAMLAGPVVAVTPPRGTVSRVLELGRYMGGMFKGRFTAPNDFSCAGKEKVSVFEVRRREAPLKIGTVMSRTPTVQHKDVSTTFTLKVKARKGTYYASLTKAKSSLDGNTCNAAKSNRVKYS